MAIRDIGFYKYLEAAFRYRLFNPQGTRATLETRFNYRGFNLPFNRIFYYARRVLPSFYRTNFPDTEEGNLQMARTVLQKLDKHQDLELDRYFDPTTTPAENAPVIAEAAEESAPQPPAAAPAAAGPLSGVGIRPPSIPRLPSVKLGKAPVQPEATQKTSESTRRFNLSRFRLPMPFVNAAKNLGSTASRFFQRNVGKFFTVGRVATVVSGGIGAVVGAGLTNSSPAGIFGGAGLGAITPSWIRSGGGAKFLSQIGNGAINFGANLSNQVSSGATRLSMSSGSKKWALGLLGAFILFFGISLFGGLTETTSPGKAGPLPPGGGGGDISNCKFTRAGNPQLIKSSILSGWISSAAASAGISSAVLASVAMHENQKFVAIDADNNNDAIKSNQFCNRGLQFCEKNGQVLHSKEREDDPCTPDEIANGARTAQAVGLMQLLDIYNPGKDLCSITENLSIAAAKLKADGITAQPTQEQINRAIRQYYNSCTYGTYSYCDEVWQDYQNCKVQPVPTPGTDFASQLVAKIKNSRDCSGYVTIFNNFYKCLDSIRPIPDLTEQALTTSVLLPGNMGVLQCVGFVKAVATDLINQPGHAITYSIPNNVLGYRFIQRQPGDIKVGDLPVWNTGLYGHIAYVVSVQNDGGFAVAEANFCLNCGKVDLRYDFTGNPTIVGWLRKNE